jgi:hypothetical protein
MNREIHVRICESLRGQFPWATRPSEFSSFEENSEVQVEDETDVFCRIQRAGAGEGPATRQPAP